MAKKKEQTANGVEQYGAADVQVLEGLEAVRRRPGMYVGGTDVKRCTTWSTRSWTMPSTRRWPGYVI